MVKGKPQERGLLAEHLTYCNTKVYMYVNVDTTIVILASLMTSQRKNMIASDKLFHYLILQRACGQSC